MPAAAINECHAIVAGVMVACRRLVIAEGADAQELLNANFQQCDIEARVARTPQLWIHPIFKLPQVHVQCCWLPAKLQSCGTQLSSINTVGSFNCALWQLRL